MPEEKIFRSSRKRGRVAVLLSGRGSNFKAIHDAMKEGRINAELTLVVSNRAEAPGLQTARERGLEALYLDPKAYPSKEAYDEAIVAELRKREIDLVCLAGYMKIVTPLFCQAFRHRIMNIHPALLPSFPGLHAQKQAVDYGVRYSGATVHFVSEEVDAGPIILQAVVPVYQDDTEETLADRILIFEHKIYPEAVRLYFEGKLEVRGRKVYILD
ncbi:MAG: phosphoribosylglycinamide formyltransferase [Candidatus Saccharicenans sp.]|jgi:phosphoribosylglycinamide formyltransferase-1|nr:phosphoribosylglycinamide formyltransferase [Candidatus Saccharicenans sp.]HOP61219.1 phosphoribosylglycinamide formyltransferase [Candidatus Saccharicenans sp.]HPU94009.1 phosphoribosylglycinamide formyltransferase [Candidatus Saccharicenans sp.]